MAATYNDGTVQYGSRVLTINSVAYAADNISVRRGTKTIDRTDHLGEPSGSVGIAENPDGSATLQLASSSTAEPPRGQTFTTTFDTTIGAETFYVTSVDRSEPKDGERKLSITFKKKIN